MIESLTAQHEGCVVELHRTINRETYAGGGSVKPSVPGRRILS